MTVPAAVSETPSPIQARSHAARVVLALGTVGALGDELLAALIAASDVRLVHVGLNQPIGSGTAKYRPWPVGSSIITADEAYVCLTGPETFVARASPVRRFDADTLLDAAAVARAAGVRRLVVVSPLSALLQMNAASHTVSTAQELELVQMRFETLVIVRPTAAELSEASGPWLGRAVRSLGRMMLEIMLPPHVQALRPRTAALAILAAVTRLHGGVHVIGSREILAIVEETMPELAPKRVRIR